MGYRDTQLGKTTKRVHNGRTTEGKRTQQAGKMQINDAFRFFEQQSGVGEYASASTEMDAGRGIEGQTGDWWSMVRHGTKEGRAGKVGMCSSRAMHSQVSAMGAVWDEPWRVNG